MHSKLKALKVVDLRDILTRASISAPQKSNKQDLIARIVAHPEALAVYNQLHGPKPSDDLLAPPEDEACPAPAPEPAPAPAPVQAPNPTTTSAPAPTPAAAPAADDELQRRRRRAERFGIPLVPEKPTPAPKKKPTAPLPDDEEKIKARAARFGTSRKRPADSVDSEELEKRKKRAERFGLPVSVYTMCCNHVMLILLLFPMARKYTDLGHPEYDALWPYTLLQDPLPELARLSLASSSASTDSVSFQPSPNPDHANQDRYIVQSWDLPDGTWSFLAVLDGHAGHDTVDYVQSTLPTFIRAALAATLPAPLQPFLPSSLPPSLTLITPLPPLSSPSFLARFLRQSRRCRIQASSTTTRTPHTHANLWVASLGDCQAVLGTKAPDGRTRIRAEHPGEPECILNNRVLGAIAVTRALGDHLFKLPAPYTERIFLNAEPPFRIATPIAEFLARNRTPPYVSSTPDVHHLAFATLLGTPTELIMCSDGLIDLCNDDDDDEGPDIRRMATGWVRAVRAYAATPGPEDNRALALLRHTLGGDDVERVSRMMTVEIDMRWMDDTTILVHRFDS
ncbi:phosphatase 2C-like domain-containing protein [Infundibulicybe gibba]|nr:phosphatase 2C-like domain-containing protein [Infundibulicybe gibba]